MKNKYIILSIILATFCFVSFLLLQSIGKANLVEEYKRLQEIRKNQSYVVDANKKPINNKKYDFIAFAGDNLIVKRDGRYGLIDTNGKTIFPITNDNILFLGDCYILVKGDNYRVYNKNYEFLFKLIDIAKIKPIGHNYFLVKGNNSINYVVNMQGEKVFNDKTDFIPDDIFKYDDITYLKIQKLQKWGLVNQNMELVIPYEYEDIQFNPRRNQLWAQKDYKWGKINLQNEVLIDFIFDSKNTSRPFELAQNRLIVQKDTPTEKTVVQTIIPNKKQTVKIVKKEEIKKPEKYKVFGDMYVVSVHKGVHESQKASTQHTIGDITVDVQVTNKPITLLLASHDAVKWRIKPYKNAKIKKIYIVGYYDGYVIAPKNIPVEKIENYYLANINKNDIKNNICESRDCKTLFRKFDKNQPYKFFTKYQTNKIIITDKEEDINLQKGGTPKTYENNTQFIYKESTNKEVLLKCTMQNCAINEADSIVKHYKKYGFNSVAYTNKFYNSGKVYFEATINREDGEIKDGIEHYSDIGIFACEDLNFVFANNFYSKNNNNPAYGMNVPLPLKDGDTISFAVDFDNGYIYRAINGKWVGAHPNSGKSEYKFLNDGRQYTAAIQVDTKTTFKVNFGAEKFKYKKPTGFKPYDTYSAKKNNVNI